MTYQRSREAGNKQEHTLEGYKNRTGKQRDPHRLLTLFHHHLVAYLKSSSNTLDDKVDSYCGDGSQSGNYFHHPALSHLHHTWGGKSQYV
uniref:Uncharacterized protein n=1 Tax=Psilocybe cubensis TaxID=181762 RepID=A0A8H7XZI1_PSICU